MPAKINIRHLYMYKPISILITWMIFILFLLQRKPQNDWFILHTNSRKIAFYKSCGLNYDDKCLQIE